MGSTSLLAINKILMKTYKKDVMIITSERLEKGPVLGREKFCSKDS
jgi:hypothetical protein